jgi:non-heme chloroperoxidase
MCAGYLAWGAFIRIAASVFLSFALSPSSAASQVEPLHTICFDTSDQVRLCYYEQLLGDTSKPTLVFIPGWTMPASIWEKQLAYFSGKYSVVAFDPRGQGISTAPKFGYTLERRIQDIKELLDRFPDNSFVIVGWSLAVLESLAYIRQYGESNLQGLVLIDNSVGEGPDRPARVGKNPFFEELRSKRKETMLAFVKDIFRTSPGADLQTRVLDSALKTQVEDSIRLLSYAKPRAYWRESIHQISIPILYLVTPAWHGQAEELTKKHPNATTIIFEHAGHALFWDEADQFNLMVHDFVRRIIGTWGDRL